MNVFRSVCPRRPTNVLDPYGRALTKWKLVNQMQVSPPTFVHVSRGSKLPRGDDGCEEAGLANSELCSPTCVLCDARPLKKRTLRTWSHLSQTPQNGTRNGKGKKPAKAGLRCLLLKRKRDMPRTNGGPGQGNNSVDMHIFFSMQSAAVPCALCDA